MRSAADIRAAALEEAFPGAVTRDVPLARMSRWRIGGTADVVVRPRDLEELSRLRAFLTAEGFTSTIIGGTTNLLFADEGLRAVLVQIGGALGKIVVDGSRIRVGAGAWVPQLARAAMKAGLAGIEHTCGIPGTVGGLVCMNGGSQRQGIGEVIVFVRSVGTDGELASHSVEECGFAYRHSAFQGGDHVVAEAIIELQVPADVAEARTEIRRRMIRIMGDRRRKFPHHTPNCGSVFVSNPAMYADYGPPGAVIQRLGFKGMRAGGAQVSPHHANFIVNTGGAGARDVLFLIHMIKSAVRDETGYDMAVEARYVKPCGEIVPADCVALSTIA